MNRMQIANIESAQASSRCESRLAQQTAPTGQGPVPLEFFRFVAPFGILQRSQLVLNSPCKSLERIYL